MAARKRNLSPKLPIKKTSPSLEREREKTRVEGEGPERERPSISTDGGRAGARPSRYDARRENPRP